MKFPILFASNATDFFSLGLGPMTNTLEATVTEERNGSFYFDAKVIIDDQCYPLLEENRIIRADASPGLLDQRFRIKKITDNHDGTAQVYAEHVSYITQELSLKPQVTVSGTGSTAINVWKNAIIDSNPLIVDSNIPTSTTTSWRIDEVENARQALGGVKGSLLDMWGGEYRFDNYHISLLQKRGTTANVLLAYGRNITDFEQERNITDTYNSLYPYAIYSDDNQKEHLVTLPTFFVDAENIANFPNRKAFPIDFSDQFKQDEVPTAAKLKSLAQSYIKSNDIGIPKVSIKVSFIDLAKTTDYADIAPLEKLNLCDEVRVIYPKLNVNTTAKVVRVVWNVLAETYDQIEIGEKRVSLSDKLNEQSQSIKEANTQANTAISASNNKNTVFYGLYGTDGLGEPIANKIGDLWFKPDGEETIMLQWDGTLWHRIINTGKLTELDQAFEESNKKIEQAEEDLAQAEKNIQDTQTKIGTVQKQANELSQSIDDQNKVIEINMDLASSAKEIAEEAKSISNKSKEIADEANSNVIAVDNIVSSVKKDVETVKNDTETAKADANNALEKSESALKDVSSINQRVQTEVSRIDGELSSKATKTTVDTLNATVNNQSTRISQTESTLQLKADQSTVNSLKGTVDNHSVQISATANDLKMKASQSSVDTINNRVNIAETNITTNANGIKGLITKTDGTNTKLTTLEANVDGFKTTVYKDYATRKELATKSDNLTYYSPGGTGDSNNYFVRFLRTNVTKRYGQVSMGFIINALGSSDGKVRSLRLDIYHKHQNVLGTDKPSLRLEVSDAIGFVSSDIVAILVENDATKGSTIDYFVRMNTTYLSFIFSPLNIIYSSSNYNFIDNDSLYPSLPSGIEKYLGNYAGAYYKVSQLEQTVDGFMTLVGEKYETKTDSLVKITKLTQDVDSFKTSVSQNYSTKGDLNTTNLKVSTIDQTVNSIRTTVSDLQVNGSSDNIIVNQDFSSNAYWSFYGDTKQYESGGYNNNSKVEIGPNSTVEYSPNITLREGRDYEIVAYVFKNTDVSGYDSNFKMRIGNRLDGSVISAYSFNDIASTKWIKIELSITGSANTSKISLSFKSDAKKGSIFICLPSITDVTDTKVINSKIATVEQDINGFKQLVSTTYAPKSSTLVYRGSITGNQNADNLETGWYNVSNWTAGPSGSFWGKLQNFSEGSREQILIAGAGKTFTRAYQGSNPGWSSWKESADKEDISETTTKISLLQQDVNGFKQTVSATYVNGKDFDNKIGQVNSDISRVEQSVSSFKVAVGQTYSTKTELQEKANAVQYNTGSSGASGSKTWVRFLRTCVKSRYLENQLSIDFLGNGSSDGINRSARIDIRHKQQNPLVTSDPTLEFVISNVVNMTDTNFRAVLVENSEKNGSIIDYFVWMNTTYLGFTLTPYNMSTQNSELIQRITETYRTSLPSGKSWSGVYGGAFLKAAQLEVKLDEIDLRVVDKNKIVSSINLNPEGLRLKGSLIHLDGTSYISDGVITSAHIAKATILNTNIKNGTITNAEISNGTILNANIADATITDAKIKELRAEKITAGTLNAANVNIINLNANNITTGDLTGINITGSTITSQKDSSKIVLDGGALSWYTTNGIVGSIYTTEENYENFANWDVYDNGYFSIRGKGTRDGETYMRYGWGELKSIVSGMVSIISKNKYADRSTSLELNNSQIILKAGSGSGSSYRQGQIQVGAYGTSVTGGMTISGGLSVTGSKNAIHQVDGQWYATPAYETAESYLGDIGSTKTNNDSMVLIPIDNLFGRIVNTSLEYQVFVSSYGSGHVWVEKRMQNAFIVRSSEPNTKFAWEIKAKRKGYEQERLVKQSLIA